MGKGDNWGNKGGVRGIRKVRRKIRCLKWKGEDPE